MEFLQRSSRCCLTSEIHAGGMIEFFHAVELDSQPKKPNSNRALPHVVEELHIRKIDPYVLRRNTINDITFPPVKILTIQDACLDAQRNPIGYDPVFDTLQLQSLTLKDCCVSVLSTLTRNGGLGNIRTFKIQGYASRANRQSALRMIVTCLPPLLFQFRQLEELELGCRQVLPMILDAICQKGGTLKKLNLSEPNSEIQGLLSVREMQHLREYCCRLVELTLDIYPSDPQVGFQVQLNFVSNN
jgi:hypothetical protein